MLAIPDTARLLPLGKQSTLLADFYKNSVFRLCSAEGPMVRGIVGPWAHGYPHLVAPGPQMDFVSECLRWWDRWLKGRKTGVEFDPLLRCYIQGTHRAEQASAHVPGRWVCEKEWPSPNVASEIWHLSTGLLLRCPTDAGRQFLDSPPDFARPAGRLCPFGFEDEFPTDRRNLVGEAGVFTSDPLAADQDYLGRPVLHVRLRSPRKVAQLVVELRAVHADGDTVLLTTGLLNLTHRNGHEKLSSLEERGYV